MTERMAARLDQRLARPRRESASDYRDHGAGERAVAARADIRVSRWEGGETSEWTRLLDQDEHAHLSHAPEWFGIIRDIYGHTPVYLRAEAAGGARALVPAFLVRRPILGSAVCSMPFLDGGGICGAARLGQGAIHSLMSEAATLGAAAVEIRTATAIDVPAPAVTTKVNLVRPLPRRAEDLWRELDGKVRNQVRKAQRSGLSVEVGGCEKVDAFYDCFAVNMRDLGSPVHARAFFHATVAAFAERARVVLVRTDSRVIGGLIAIAFKNTLVVPWASSLRRYRSLCPNVILYWETMARACQDGFRQFEFGRSTRGSGTYHFKRQWGADEWPLYWYRISLHGRGHQPVSQASPRGRVLAACWTRLPVGVSRWIGPRIRKYLTQ